MEASGKDSGRRTVIILLAFVLAVGIVAAVMLITLAPSRERPEEAASAAAAAGGAPTARTAYELARPVALAWADDAQLASVAGAWTQPIDMDAVYAGQTSWSFFFYSRSRAEMATVVTDQESAQFITSTPFPGEMVLLSDVGWVLDSQDVARLLMENGGVEFMSGHSNVAINLRLSTATSNGRLLWIASVVSGDQLETASFVVEVDATSGEVLNVY
jgi:hypothetical protein